MSTNLVSTWFEFVTRDHEGGKTEAMVRALDELNRALGTRYRLNRLYEWLSGKREPNRIARNYMLRTCLEDVLVRHGVPATKARNMAGDRIAEELT